MQKNVDKNAVFVCPLRFNGYSLVYGHSIRVSAGIEFQAALRIDYPNSTGFELVSYFTLPRKVRLQQPLE